MDVIAETQRVCQKMEGRKFPFELLGETTPPPCVFAEPEADNLPQPNNAGHGWCTVLGGSPLDPNSLVTTASQFGPLEGVDVWLGGFPPVPPAASPFLQLDMEETLQHVTSLKRKHENELDDEDQPHVKRPLNASVFFKEEERLMAKCNLWNDTVLNILGEMWKPQVMMEEPEFESSTVETGMLLSSQLKTEMDFPICDISADELGFVIIPDLPGGTSPEMMSPVAPFEPPAMMPMEQPELEPSTAQPVQAQPALSLPDMASPVCDHSDVDKMGQSDSQFDLSNPQIPLTFPSASLARVMIELLESECCIEEMILLQPPHSHFETNFCPDTDILTNM